MRNPWPGNFEYLVKMPRLRLALPQSGAVRRDVPVDTCRPSPFPTQNLTGTINGSSTSPNRGPGFFNTLITFQGTAGQSISIWYQAPFGAYMYLMNPNNVVIAEGVDNGFTFATDSSNAAIIITLPTTGTYTIDATTAAAGDTGDIRLQVSAGVETDIPQDVGNWVVIDSPSTKRFFIASGYAAGGPNHGHAITYDSATYGVLSDIDLGTSGAPQNAVIEYQTGFLNPNDNSIWLWSSNNSFFGWYRINPLTGAIIEQVIGDTNLEFVNLFTGVYSPHRNKFYMVNATFSHFMASYDCNTRLTNLSAIDFGTTDQMNINGMYYDSLTDRLIINVPGHATYLVSSDDTAITPLCAIQVNASPIYPVVGRVMYGLTDDFPIRMIATNIDTGAQTVLVDNWASYNNPQGPWYNPCLNCLEIIQKVGGSTLTFNLVRFKLDGTFIECKDIGDESAFDPSNAALAVAWNSVDTRQVYAFLHHCVTVP